MAANLLLNCIKKLFPGRSRRERRHLSQATKRKAPMMRPNVEVLEDRITPSTYNVTDLNGAAGSGSAGDVTLPYAVANAVSGDTITFDSTLYAGGPATITLNSTLNLANGVTVTGPGAANVAVSGGATVQVFNVAAGAAATSITDLTIENGTISGSGGGLNNSGTLSLSNDTFSGSHASAYGGGVFNAATATLSIDSCTFTGNSAGSTGGGVWNYGTLTVSNSTFTNNTGTWGGGLGNAGSAAFGGGPGLATVTGSTFSNNHATAANSGGGGVDNLGGTLTLSNSTVTNNTAFSGGGVNNNGGVMTLTNDTIANNTATFGGGVSQINYFSGSPTLQSDNCIIAGNTATTRPAIGISSGSITNFNSNLVDNATGLTFTSGTGNLLNNTNANLASSLASNGGPTQTLALQATSAAIYAGDPGQSGTTAQNGITRPATPDIGAFQSTFAPTVTPNTANLPNNYTIMVINGLDFSPNPADDAVTFDNGVTGVVTAATGTSLTVSLTGLGSVAPGTNLNASVTVFGLTSSTVQVATVTAAVPPPVVTSSTANRADNSAAALIIQGSNFDPTAANDFVTFNHGAVGTVTAATATQLTVTFTTPPTAVGLLTAVVSISGGLTSGAAVNVATVTNATWTVTDAAGSGGSLADVTLPFAVAHTLSGDSIVFASSLSGNTIHLASTLNVNSSVTIDGSGAPGLKVSGYTPGLVGTYFNIGASTNMLNTSDPAWLGNQTPAVTAQLVGPIDFPDIQAEADTGVGFRDTLGNTYYNLNTLFGQQNNNNVEGRWVGSIIIPGTGASPIPVNFQTGSDDGSVLYIDGTEVVNNDFFQGVTYRTGLANLTPGLHTIDVEFMQGGGGAAMFARWDPTGGTNFVDIPNSAFISHQVQVFTVGAGVSASISNLTIQDGTASAGGGVLNNGTLTLSGDTITNNTATGQGGGGVANAGTLTVINSTVAFNTAPNGAGIGNGGTLTLSNDTIAYNNGGGVGNLATERIQNTIITANTGGDIQDAGTTTLGANNVISGANVLTATLANHGGPTQTITLSAGSPAVGAGGALTTVATSVSVSSTTITVADGAAIAVTPGSYFILIGTEEMLVTSVSGNVLTVQRGYNGTTAATHAVGANVQVAVDQRGHATPTPQDIGAYQDFTPTVTSNTANLADSATTLIITGTHFSTTPGDNLVAFDEGLAGIVTAATATQLTVTITAPPTALGALHATVTVGGHTSTNVQVATEINSTWTVTDVSGFGGSLSDLTLPYAVAHTLSGDSIGFASSLSGQTITSAGTMTVNSNITISGAGAPGLKVDAGLVQGLVGNYFNIGSSQNQLISSNAAWLGHQAPAATALLLGAVDFPNIAYGGGFVDNLGNSYYTYGGNQNNVEGRWYGDIIIPGTGATPVPVNFQTGSDDGSVIYIDGSLVVNNNFYQGVTYRSGSVNLTPGLHTIDIEFMQGGGGAAMFARWDPTGGTSFVDIPNSAFLAPAPTQVFNVPGTVTATISNLTIMNGVAASGAGLNNAGTLTLSNDTFTGNNASSNGGAIFNSGTLIVNNSTVTNNSATGSGGGIYNAGTLTLNDDTVAYNISTNGAGGLGGTGSSTNTMNNTIMAGNNYQLQGLTGQYFNIPATTNMLVSTDPSWLGVQAPAVTTQLLGPIDFPNISGNGFADSVGNPAYYNIPGNNNNVEGRWVGQILIPGTGTSPVPVNFRTGSDDGSVLYIDGNLVVNNDFFQGVTYRTGLVNLTPGLHDIDVEFMQGGGGAAMFAQWDPTGGTTWVDIPNSVLTVPLNNNNISSGVTVTGANNATSLTGLGLAASLGSNGGPTQTLAISSTSSAIGAAGATSLSTDQRGFGRPASAPDIGAFQLQTVTPNTALLPVNSTTLTISGTTFDPTAANNVVTFDNGVTGTVTASTGTTLTVNITGGLSSVAGGTAIHASVTVDGVSSGAAVQVATAQPVITPTTINLPLNATSMVISGFGFGTVAANDTVTFDNGMTGSVTGAAGTTLTVSILGNGTLPIGTVVHASVTVNGVSNGSLVQVATISAAVFPSVASSTSNIPDSSTTITINGSNFATSITNDTVVFNLGVVGTVTSATTTQLVVTVTNPPTALGVLTAVVTAFGASSGAPVQIGTEVNSTWTVTDGGSGNGSMADVTLKYAVASTLNGDSIGFASSLSNSTITLGSSLTLTHNVAIDGSGAPGLAISGLSSVQGLQGMYYNINATTNMLTSTDPLWLGNQTPAVTALLVGPVDFPDIQQDGSAMGFTDPLGHTYYNLNSTPGQGNNNNVEGRWVGDIIIPGAGTSPVPINFQTGSDDGSVIYIDGNLVVNNNFFQGVTNRTGSVNLTPGMHAIDIEFMQGGGGAAMVAQWDPTGGTNFVDIPNSAFRYVSHGNQVFNIPSGVSASISNLTITGGGQTANGGGVLNAGTLTLNGDTFTNNQATAAGGAIANSGTLTVINSTIANNSAPQGGGIGNSGTLTLSNDTIAYNTATTAGGVGTLGTTTIQNTIVAGNTGGDVVGTFTGGGNVIGVTYGLAASLASNGGPTQTIAITQPDSPEIANGLALTSVSASVAISDTTISVQNAAAIAQNAGSYYITIDQEQMLVTNVNTTTNTLTVQRGANGTTAATHAVAAGVFLANDQRGVVRQYLPTIGAYQKNVFIVTDDNGHAGSGGPNDVTLPYALSQVDAGQGVPIIYFAPTLSGATGNTIILDTTLAITSNVTINGQGAANLTVSGNNAVQVFNVATGVTASIFNIAITNGTTGNGGEVYSNGALTLGNVTVSGNTNSGSANGIYSDALGTLTLSTTVGGVAGTTTIGDNISIQGVGMTLAGAGTMTISGNVNLGTGTLTDSSSGTDTISGVIQGSAPLPSLPNIPGLQYELDASNAGSVITNGSGVQQWNDLSGNGYNFAATTYLGSSQEPQLIPNAINGLPALQFYDNGQGTVLTGGAANVNAQTVIIVNFISGTSNCCDGIWGVYGNNVDESIRVNDGTGGTAFQGNPGSGNGNDYTVAGNGSTWISEAGSFDQNTTAVGALGTVNIMTATGNFTPANFGQTLYQLGGGSYADRYFRGDIGEVLVYNTQLTAAQRQSVEQYLSNKWLGTSLGSGTGNSVVKTGTGTLTLSQTNSYTGGTLVNGGTLVATADGAMGPATNPGITVNTGGALAFSGGVNYTTAEPTTINGTGPAGHGAIDNISGTNTFAAPITLGSNATIGSDSGTLSLTSPTLNMATSDLTTTGSGNVLISSVIAGTTIPPAYVGFTGATGGAVSVQNILNWTYTSGSTTVDDSAGFASSDLVLNNGASIQGSSLQLTDGGGSEARTAWVPSPVPISNFATTFQWTYAGTGGGPADGFTFAVQNNGNNVVGNAGGGLAYQGIAGNSIALEFNLYNGSGTGSGSDFGLGLNGAVNHNINLVPYGINFSANPNDTYQATATLSGSILTVNLWDWTTNSSAVPNYTTTFTLPIPANNVTKNGTGTLTLSNTNTYTGRTTINSGTLVATADAAMGPATAAGIVVNSGAALAFSGNVNYATAEPITISGSGPAGNGAIENISGANTFAGPIAYVGAVTLGTDAGSLTLNGDISGGNDSPSDALTLVGAGNMTINGNVSLGKYGNFTSFGSGQDVVAGTLSGTAVGGVTQQFVVGTYFNIGATTNMLVSTDPLWLGNQTPAVTAPLLGPIDFPDIQQDGSAMGFTDPLGNTYYNLNTTPGQGNNNNVEGRWVGPLTVPGSGTTPVPVNFQTGSDDGSVIYIDGTLVVNNNFFQGVVNRQGSINLTPGVHTIDVEYMQGGGGAAMVAQWDPTGGTNFVDIPLSAMTRNLSVNNVTMSGIGGTLVLSNTDGYTGATAVTTGTLQVDGSIVSSSGTTVSLGATLDGSGTTGATSVSGTIQGGSASAVGTLTTDLTFSGTGVFKAVLDSATSYSQVVVTGTTPIDLSNSPSLNLVLGFTPTLGESFTLISNQTGLPVNGQFSQGGTINAGTDSFTISYTGGTNGDDVVLTVVGVNTTPTTTTLVDNGPNPSLVGHSVTLVATVAGASIPNGETITVRDASNSNVVVGSGTTSGGSATIVISTLGVGTHNLFATYPGDISNGNSDSNQVTQTVNALPGTTTSLVDNGPNPSTYGQTVTFVATVAGQASIPDGETVTLEDASRGNAVVGTGVTSGGSVTFNISSLGFGTHNIFAHYAGDFNNAASDSSQVTQTVNNAPTTGLAVYEPFNYYVPTNSVDPTVNDAAAITLAGEGPGLGNTSSIGLTGTYTNETNTVGNTSYLDEVVPGNSFDSGSIPGGGTLNYPEAGAPASVAPVGNLLVNTYGAASTMQISLSSPFGDVSNGGTGGGFWISYLISPTVAAGGYGGIELVGNNANHDGIFLGYYNSPQQYGGSIVQGNVIQNPTFTQNVTTSVLTPVHLAAWVTVIPGVGTTVTSYINPGFGAAPAAGSLLSTFTSTDDLGNIVALATYSGTQRSWKDEIRVGTSYSNLWTDPTTQGATTTLATPASDPRYSGVRVPDVANAGYGAGNLSGGNTGLTYIQSNGTGVGSSVIVQFDNLSSYVPAGDIITSARVILTGAYPMGTYTAGAYPTAAYNITSAWTEASTSPTVDTSAAVATGVGTMALGQYSYDITTLAQGWLSGSIANNGIDIAQTDTGNFSTTLGFWDRLAGGFHSGTGYYPLNGDRPVLVLTVAPENGIAPTVLTQPSPQTVLAGGTATFTSTASGTPAPTVQWEVSTDGGVTYTPINNGGVYSGATTNTLTITGATTDMSGFRYEAFFSNTAGQATSNPAALTVNNGAAPAVVSVVVNGGAPQYTDGNGVQVSLAGQNSIVEQLLVTFNEPVTLDAGAFTISTNLANFQSLGGVELPNTDPVGLNAPIPVTGSGGTQFILTFLAGSGVNSIPGPGVGTYIKDGVYNLNTIGSHVHANSQTAVDNHAGFWALFGSVAADNLISGSIGDGNSDILVDTPDAAQFKIAFGTENDSSLLPDQAYDAAMDSNLSGVIGTEDAAKFKHNFGTEWMF